MVAGKYQVKPPLPFIPGAEFSGEIVALGRDCSNFTVGQRVLATRGLGGLAEEVCVSGRAVVPLPDELDYLTAAAFLLAYGTSYHALRQRAGLVAGETLLVLGAAGGVGLAAVQIGKLLGARVIAAAGSPEKLSLARQHGADATVNYSEVNLKTAVRDLTSDRGADVIFDPVGGELFDHCLRSVSWGGRILIVGFAGGTIQAIPANLLLLKGSSVSGVFWGRFAELEPQVHRKNTQELLSALGEGRLKPHIGGVFSLGQAGEALQLLADRRATGKIVVQVRR
jgi:NADPH2:quinone reductase